MFVKVNWEISRLRREKHQAMLRMRLFVLCFMLLDFNMSRFQLKANFVLQLMTLKARDDAERKTRALCTWPTTTVASRVD